jgi:AraC family transcriptional regulator, regulatory protein of adaptative response / methylphosphotriester-DNA alkyltransferase methyltransferase
VALVTPTEPRLSISHARAGARRVIVVAGVVDVDAAAGLAAVLARAGRCAEPVALDLCDADVDDAAGAALVINAVRRLQRRRRDVAVVCPPGRIATALRRAGLTRTITLVADRDDLAALAPAAPPPAHTAPPPAHTDPPRAQRPATPGRRGALLADATLAIEARHAEPDLALSDVARQIATSERQLQRVFAELAHSAFRDEVAAVRMQHAAALLQTTDLPVGDIARRVGYRQAAQFAKAFRRHHALSPTAFRRAQLDLRASRVAAAARPAPFASQS